MIAHNCRLTVCKYIVQRHCHIWNNWMHFISTTFNYSRLDYYRIHSLGEFQGSSHSAYNWISFSNFTNCTTYHIFCFRTIFLKFASLTTLLITIDRTINCVPQDVCGTGMGECTPVKVNQTTIFISHNFYFNLSYLSDIHHKTF